MSSTGMRRRPRMRSGIGSCRAQRMPKLGPKQQKSRRRVVQPLDLTKLPPRFRSMEMTDRSPASNYKYAREVGAALVDFCLKAAMSDNVVGQLGRELCKVENISAHIKMQAKVLARPARPRRPVPRPGPLFLLLLSCGGWRQRRVG